MYMIYHHSISSLPRPNTLTPSHTHTLTATSTNVTYLILAQRSGSTISESDSCISTIARIYERRINSIAKQHTARRWPHTSLEIKNYIDKITQNYIYRMALT